MAHIGFFSRDFSRSLRTTLNRLLDEREPGACVSAVALAIAIGLTSDEDDVALVRIAVPHVIEGVQARRGRNGGFYRPVATEVQAAEPSTAPVDEPTAEVSAPAEETAAA